MVRVVSGLGRACCYLLVLGLTVAAGCLGAPQDAPDDPRGDAAVDPECDDAFGSARGYILCSGDEGSCTFFVNLEGDFTCAIACGEFAVACQGGFDNADTPDICAIESEAGCDTLHADQICICARPGV